VGAIPVESISIIGNEHTRDHIILRELQHPIPAEFDSTKAGADRDRIYNLGLFSTVEIQQVDSVYTIYVVETFPIIPIPIIEYDEGKGVSWGGGIAYLNFRGLNEKLIFGGVTGNQSTYFFDFIDPWVWGDHISLGAYLVQYTSDSPVYDYQLMIQNIQFESGFYTGYNHKYNFEIAYQYISLDSSYSTTYEYSRFPYNFSLTSFTYLNGLIYYQYDTRDVYTDPTKGERLKIRLSPALGLSNTSNRLQVEISYKKYHLLKGIALDPVLSTNSKLVFKDTYNLPVFEKEYLGGEGYVRGYSPIIQQNPEEVQSRMEGSQILYQNMQLQHTLLPRKDYRKVELGIDLAYFIDFGISANSPRNFSLKNSIIGYGAGVRLFLSGAGVISIDFGYNPYGTFFVHPTNGDY
jgi:outer membrane protein assembly factor BamA